MAVKVEERGGRLGYRVYFAGWESREPTSLKATPKNHEKMARMAEVMSDLMAEGRFDYLKWFPNGNRARLFRPPPATDPEVPQTIAEYAEQTWLPRSQPPRVRATLARTRRKHCRHILRVLGDRRLDTLSPGDLEDLRTQLTEPSAHGGCGLRMKSARDIIDSSFRALYRDARLIDYKTAFRSRKPVAEDPFMVLKWPRKILPTPDPFEEDERDRILSVLWSSKRHYYAFVFLLFATGLRIGEAVGLRWGDVDLRRAKLHVRRSRTLSEDNPPKTQNAARTITLLPEVVAVLRNIQSRRAMQETFVFTTEASTPLEAERFVEKHWRSAVRKCGVRLRKLSATRHTFMSVALVKGAKIKWLANYCGTSVEMIERHYSRWLGGDDDQLALLACPGVQSTKIQAVV
jgi:integrase